MDQIEKHALKPSDKSGSRPKKKADAFVEVLPHRSWITNFYHNFIKASQLANLNRQRIAPGKIKHAEEKGGPVHGSHTNPHKGVSSLYNSTLMVQPGKLNPELLKSARPDREVIEVLQNHFAKQRQAIGLAKEAAVREGVTKATSEATNSAGAQRITAPPIPNKDDRQVRNTEVKATFTLDQLPLRQLNKLGLSQDILHKNGVLDRLLQGKKTEPVKGLQIHNGKGEKLTYNASFKLEKQSDGTARLLVNYLPQKNSSGLLPRELKSKLGSVDKVASLAGSALNMPTLKRLLQSFTIKKADGKVQVLGPKALRLPTIVKGIKLNKDQRKALSEGKPIAAAGLIANDGTRYNATLQVDRKTNKLTVRNATPHTKSQHSNQAFTAITARSNQSNGTKQNASTSIFKQNKQSRVEGAGVKPQVNAITPKRGKRL
jgi:hypothetical protein